MVLKKLILTVSTLGECGGLDKTQFSHLLLWEGLVALKELILKISTLGGCGGLDKTHF